MYTECQLGCQRYSQIRWLDVGGGGLQELTRTETLHVLLERLEAALHTFVIDAAKLLLITSSNMNGPHQRHEPGT